MLASEGHLSTSAFLHYCLCGCKRIGGATLAFLSAVESFYREADASSSDSQMVLFSSWRCAAVQCFEHLRNGAVWARFYKSHHRLACIWQRNHIR